MQCFVQRRGNVLRWCECHFCLWKSVIAVIVVVVVVVVVVEEIITLEVAVAVVFTV